MFYGWNGKKGDEECKMVKRLNAKQFRTSGNRVCCLMGNMDAGMAKMLGIQGDVIEKYRDGIPCDVGRMGDGDFMSTPRLLKKRKLTFTPVAPKGGNKVVKRNEVCILGRD